MEIKKNSSYLKKFIHERKSAMPVFDRIITVCLAMISLMQWMAPGPVAWAGQLTARQIMEQVEKQRAVKNRSHDMTMTLIDPNGSTQKRGFKVFSKETNEIKKKIMFVTFPPRLKHTGFLTFDYPDNTREDDQWIYLPSMGKHKRIASADRDDSFMGSDLNYSDLNSKQLDDYTYQILKDTKVKQTPAWLIESLPKSASVIEKTGYKKSILAIQQDTYAILRIMAWSHDNKTIKIHDFNDFVFIENTWVPKNIIVVSRVGNVTQHTTRLQINHIQLGMDLADDLFTVRSLKQGFSR